MRSIISLASLFILSACGAPKVEGLLSQWTLQQEGSSRKWEVSVPSTVAGALNQAGYFGENVKELDRYAGIDKAPFDSPWTYTTRFAAEKGKCHVLRFDGLNFYADITLNGVTLASADTTFGTFAVREFDVTKLVKGRNTLKVTLRRAQSGDLNTGYVDWNPRPVDESMGIIRPVSLISTPDVQVQDVYVKPVLDPADLSQARLEVAVTLVNRSERAVEGTLQGSYEGGSFALPVSLEAGESRIFRTRETVSQPRIWWAREMGSPELYHLDAAFVKDGLVSHHKAVRFGIRDIKAYVDEAGHRQFELNGRKLLIKAGGWTDDIFMEDSPEKLLEQVALTADMGLNCIRFENIWGKDDTVYDYCDSLGILSLVGWSCQWEWKDYCGLEETKGYGCINDPRSEALAVRYFRDQVIRLRNHASVIGWLTGSDLIPNPRLEQQYLAIFEKEDYRPYVCSAKAITSLAGPSGMKMEGPYEYVGPDYWWVDTQSGGAFGFNTETGPGLNLPQKESLLKMLGADPWPVSRVWDYHCTASSSHMNNTAFLDKAMEDTYGKATDLDDYIRKAHALDYDSVRSMFEAFRGNLPGTTGIVMWMLNSAWPSLYWQLFDWYNIPTAGYYGTKAATRPVQLVYNYADHCIWAVNDAIPEASLTATMKVYDASSRLVKEERRQIVSRERTPLKVFGAVEGPCFIDLELTCGEFTFHNFYCIPAKGGEYDWKHVDWWGIPMTSHADLSFVTALPKADVKLRLPGELVAGGQYTLELENSSDVVAYQLILKAFDTDGELISGPLWEENFLSLAPGASRKVLLTLPAGEEVSQIRLEGWNAEVTYE